MGTKELTGGSAYALGKATAREAAAIYEAVRVLFLRLEQLQGADRVSFELTPEKGTEYKATVRLAAAVRAKGVPSPAACERSAVGPNEEGAMRALAEQLARALRERVKADVGALELAGFPLDPSFFGEGWGRVVRHPTGGAGDVITTTGEEVREGRPALDVVASLDALARRR